MMRPERQRRNMVPPNGGWGWVVVCGVALSNSFNQALLSVYGLLFGEKLVEMGENTFGAALVGNIMLVVTSFSGLIAGPALKKYSVRQISIIGSLLTGIGLIGSSFATNIWHLIASYSVFTGLGIGLLQPSTFMAVNDYFTSKRGRAVGASMAGTGIGQMLMPHLVRYLLDEFSFKGTALILGGLAFNGIVGSALFQPVKWYLIPENEETRLLNRHEKKPEEEMFIEDQAEGTDEVETIFEATSYQNEPLMIDTQEEKKQENVKQVNKLTKLFTGIMNFFDLDLLLDLVFLNIILGVALGFTSNQNFNMFFPFFLQQQVGLSRSQTAMCMSSLAAADILARLTIPVVTDHCRISSRKSYFVSCFILTAARIILTFQTDYVCLLLAAALNGFSRSPIIVNQNLVVSEHFAKGDPKLPTALGLCMVMRGLTIISLGQLLGWIRDYSGSYIVCINAQSLLLILIIATWTPEFIIKRCLSRH